MENCFSPFVHAQQQQQQQQQQQPKIKKSSLEILIWTNAGRPSQSSPPSYIYETWEIIFLGEKKKMTYLCNNATWQFLQQKKLNKYLIQKNIRALQHSMGNFYREFPQLRCTELQLKMRLAGLHLQLKRVAHEQNTRLAVSSRA